MKLRPLFRPRLRPSNLPTLAYIEHSAELRSWWNGIALGLVIGAGLATALFHR